MRDSKPDLPDETALYPSPIEQDSQPRWSATEIIAFSLSGLWLLATAIFFLVLGNSPGTAFDPLRFIVTILAIFMPVALIWVAATAAKSARTMRSESARLEAAIERIRRDAVAGNPRGRPQEVEQKLNKLISAQRETQASLANLGNPAPNEATQSHAAATDDHAAQAVSAQTALSLDIPVEENSAPLSNEDFIAALHFPTDENDQEGFQALRRGLADHVTAQLIKSAQDVLTLLSQDGIYMDDLRPDRARTEIWRRFANGERGPELAPLAGIRDRTSLTVTAARMREDFVFRDAAHDFLRKFDRSFAAWAPKASDAEIAVFAETRTARAFMLLGRVAGVFS